jgi:hypothetical protein
VLYKFDAKIINKSTNESYGISCNVDQDAEPGTTSGTNDDANHVSVIDVVDGYNLMETYFDKKSYLLHLKDYFSSLKTKVLGPRYGGDTSRIDEWQTKVQKVVKDNILGKFDDFRFFSGREMGPDGICMTLLMGYHEDGTTPYFIIWKDGLRDIKV